MVKQRVAQKNVLPLNEERGIGRSAEALRQFVWLAAMLEHVDDIWKNRPKKDITTVAFLSHAHLLLPFRKAMAVFKQPPCRAGPPHSTTGDRTLCRGPLEPLSYTLKTTATQHVFSAGNKAEATLHLNSPSAPVRERL